ncbi:MAG: DUF4974 domain-containing protein [Muribaculaceae bacterium]|nr:DUF4974 domain-containing protein [Muribaculaceae bacterium]
MNTERIIDILYKQLTGGRLTAGEQALLEAWIAENPEKRRKIAEGLADPMRIAEYYRMRSMIDKSRPMNEMMRRLGIQADEEIVSLASSHRNKWIHYLLKTSIAAACVAVLAGIFLVFKESRNVQSTQPAVVASLQNTPLQIENLGPGGSRAVVTTEKGDTIHLSGPESARYISENATEGPLQIDVPRGGEFVVTLEDSTRVWLNSESRLVYPARFASDSRRVELEGEAYFEVSKNPEAPFFVEAAGQRVKVYGTEFNIRAYPEDALVYTTLSSGSISLTPTTGGGEVFISPGKQAMFDKETAKAAIRNVDIERVTGWRHGRFVFEEQSLRQIMRDLSRWYDFKYEFADEDAAETIFMGSIPRYSNFKTAIAILEKSGGLSFKVKDNRIVISSKQ